MVVKIEAHEQAVWAVRFVGEDRILTGEQNRAQTACFISFMRSRGRQQNHPPLIRRSLRQINDIAGVQWSLSASQRAEPETG